MKPIDILNDPRLRAELTEIISGTPFGDQLNAAAAEASDTVIAAMIARGGTVEPTIQHPGEPVPAPIAWLIEAWSDGINSPGSSACEHLTADLKAGTMQTATWKASSPGKIVCARRCARLIDPEPGDDQCDRCHKTGVTQFWPVNLPVGFTILGGDICGDCKEEITS